MKTEKKNFLILPIALVVGILGSAIGFYFGNLVGLMSLFVLSYIGISMEVGLQVEKLAIALVAAIAIWSLIIIFKIPIYLTTSHGLEESQLEEVLSHHTFDVAQIAFFLMGAMGIVAIMDHKEFDSFSIIRRNITTKNKIRLLWIAGIVSFFLSAIIDNMTTMIIISAILAQMVPEKKLKWFFFGMMVIAANAGGAWSPLGDVTTTMLWIAMKIEPVSTIKRLFLPSLMAMAAPFLIASFLPILKGNIEGDLDEVQSSRPKKISGVMLVAGFLAILLVPLLKITIHLPPFLGMIGAFGMLVIFAEIITSRRFSFPEIGTENDHHSMLHHALMKIEVNNIFFFIGILLAVGGLESVAIIFNLGEIAQNNMSTMAFINVIGFLSAVFDNVPLVAAAIGMFASIANNDIAWHFLAYTAGTGGSMLVIGSAAGVIIMGKGVTFGWYLKNISGLALIGYFAGVLTFYLIN